MFISDVKVTPEGTGSKSKQPNRFEFLVKPPSGKPRVYYLSAESAEDRAAWIAAINKWVGVVDDVTRRATLSFVAESEADRGSANDDDDDLFDAHSARQAAAAPLSPRQPAPAAAAAPAPAPAPAAVVVKHQVITPPAAAPAAVTPSVVSSGALSPTNPFAPPPVQLSSNNPFAPLVAVSPTNPFASELASPVKQVALSPTAVRIVAEGSDPLAVQRQLEIAAQEYAADAKAAIQLDAGFKEVSRNIERIEFEGGFEEITTVTASDGKGTTKTYKNTVRIRAGTVES